MHIYTSNAHRSRSGTGALLETEESAYPWAIERGVRDDMLPACDGMLVEFH
jgi:hypothetical protein